MNSSVASPPGKRSSTRSWASVEPQMGDSTIARYNRVAAVETVLSIRDRRQQSARRLIAATLVLVGVAVIAAGILGWI